MKPLRIGTRRSKLALAQAEEIRRLLTAHGTPSELVPMSTSGDEGAPASASPAGLKGLFVDAILEALESGNIDLAVHSAKDLPAEEDDGGFVIAAVPERADARDVLVTKGATLGPGARVGTSSLRRRAQLLRSGAGISVVQLRGNVDTRLRKLEEGEVDAVVLAAAGLARLGVSPQHATVLSVDEMMPAPGQGCLAVQCRDDDERIRGLLAPLDHVSSHVALEAERSLMWRLGGGCNLPFGAYATVDVGLVRLTALVATPDGGEIARAGGEADSAEGAAAVTARALIEAGAEAILEELVE